MKVFTFFALQKIVQYSVVSMVYLENGNEKMGGNLGKIRFYSTEQQDIYGHALVSIRYIISKIIGNP